MSPLKPEIFSKVIERVGQLGADEVQAYLHRLAKEQAIFEAIFNAVQVGIIVGNDEGIIQYYNPEAARLLGFSENGVVGEKIEKYVRGLNWRQLLEKESTTTRELEITYPQRRYLYIYTVPLSHEDGLAYALILHDATESREAMREAAESERFHAVMALAAGVAHEIGNPLNSFNIQLQLMDRELKKLKGAELEKIREAVRVARNEVLRLDGIIKQFLQAVRPSLPKFQRMSMNEVVEGSLQFFNHEIEDRDLILEIELAPNLPFVSLDPDQMKQVFFNLIRNAIQSMRKGGILRVETRFDDCGVVVSFRDTGAGMTPEVMSRLFEPYYTTKQGGTGLGLIIVRRIVREHGGELEFDSQPGRGTEVRVRLPYPGPKAKLLQ